MRRENFQLRKEIWTLRDEYDRLGKLLKTKDRVIDELEHSPNDCTAMTNDCKYDCEYEDADHCSCSCLSNEVNFNIFFLLLNLQKQN